jgi:hypothetical protein
LGLLLARRLQVGRCNGRAECIAKRDDLAAAVVSRRGFPACFQRVKERGGRRRTVKIARDPDVRFSAYSGAPGCGFWHRQCSARPDTAGRCRALRQSPEGAGRATEGARRQGCAQCVRLGYCGSPNLVSAAGVT